LTVASRLPVMMNGMCTAMHVMASAWPVRVCSQRPEMVSTTCPEASGYDMHSHPHAVLTVSPASHAHAQVQDQAKEAMNLRVHVHLSARDMQSSWTRHAAAWTGATLTLVSAAQNSMLRSHAMALMAVPLSTKRFHGLAPVSKLHRKTCTPSKLFKCCLLRVFDQIHFVWEVPKPKVAQYDVMRRTTLDLQAKVTHAPRVQVCTLV